MKKLLILLAVATLLFAVAAVPILEVKVSPEILISLSSAALSLLFSYVPGLNVWFAAKPEEMKKLLMLIMLAVVVFGIYGLMCAGVISVFEMVCAISSLWTLLWYLILAVVANQGVYSVTTLPEVARKVKID